MYSFDFRLWIKLLLPPEWHNGFTIAALFTRVKPLQSLLDGPFNEFTIDARRRAKFTGQVIYLEKMLNDDFNAGGQDPIFIQDTANIQYTYLANAAEGYPPTYFANTAENAPVYLCNASEYGIGNSFIVMVPAILYSALQLNNNNGLDKMRAQVNYYKIAGKTFTIEPY